MSSSCSSPSSSSAGTSSPAAGSGRTSPPSSTELEAVNEALALARASDKGWERSLLEAACRARVRRALRGRDPDLQLVQVVDQPGTEDDQAVFRVVTDHGSEHLHLDRHGDTWVAR